MLALVLVLVLVFVIFDDVQVLDEEDIEPGVEADGDVLRGDPLAEGDEVIDGRA